MRPRLLDLFCCQGGTSMGYHRAGFDVTGVDLLPQPRYPFPFIQSDALEYLAGHGNEYDVIAASPPCQQHSALRTMTKRTDGHLLADTITALRDHGGVWCVENVEGADMPGSITLCGSMFGLAIDTADRGRRHLRRHRQFVASVPLRAPGPDACQGLPIIGVYGGGGNRRLGRAYTASADELRALLDVPWMCRNGGAQAIPPAYAEHIGRQLLTAVAR